MHLGLSNDLRYTWGNALNTFLWAPGLVLPDGEWAFCALVVTPTEARLHLGTGGGAAGGGTLTTAVNPVAHMVESFGGTTHIGWDPQSALRHFAGGMDDIRVYDHALSDGAIADLFERGGGAQLPSPSDGAVLDGPDASLRWVAGHGVVVHEVYIGDSYQAVAEAGPSAPEYEGSTIASSWSPAAQGGGPLPAGSRFYWRVDTLTMNGYAPGVVWQARVADTGHWRLDEPVGSALAVDAHGLHDGVFGSGVGLEKLPATPHTGSSIRLSGSSPQEVVIPALGLDSNRVTISAWVRRIDDQIDWSGLVFCRGGTTVAGLNVGEDNELRYHWDGGKWEWNSGLVLPDKQWAFCTLVVEPDQATIYMGIEGAPLQSAINVGGHGAEAFDAELRLGRDPTSNRWFNGRLDDVRVFDRALSAKDVQRLYDDALSGAF